MTHPHDPGTGKCREIFSRLSEYMDGELPPDFCDRIDAHLEDCPPCRAFLRSLRNTVDWIQGQEVPELPEDLRESIRRAYHHCRGSGGA